MKSGFFNTIKYANKSSSLFETIEVKYSVDTIEVDDSYLQLGWSKHFRKYLNPKGVRKIKDIKDNYKNDVNMFAGFYISAWPKGLAYERKIYEILDCLGNIGGFQEGFGYLFVALNFIFASGLVTVNQADMYLEIAGEEEKVRGCCFYFLTIFKYFFYFIPFG